MEALGILIILVFLVLVLVLPIVAISKSSSAQQEVQALREKMQDLLLKLANLHARLDKLQSEKSAPTEPGLAGDLQSAKVTEPTVPTAQAIQPTSEPPPTPIAERPAELIAPVESKPVAPPPLPSRFAAAMAATEPAVAEKSSPSQAPASSQPLPPPLPAGPPKVQTSAPVFAKKPELNLEQFLGVKLFAWLGGIALFFGIVFFVKYAFEHDLIPPQVRVAIAYFIGVSLVAGGVLTHRKQRYVELALTFCASGVLILYGASYLAYGHYQLISAPVAFGAMTLTTALAFGLSVRFNALPVAVLALVGGFSTPIVCSTGQDQPWILFGYIALLDIGLLAVARVQKWFFLASLGAAGTVLMQLGWATEFFVKGRYFEGDHIWTPITICAGLIVLFLIASLRARKRALDDLHPSGAAMAVCASAMAFAFLLLEHPESASRTWVLYGFVFFINAAVLAGVIIQPKLAGAQLIVGLASFVHLATWTLDQLQPSGLNSALAVYFVFGALHSVFPIVWQKLKPENAVSLQGAFSPWFPPLSLLLMLLPVLKFPETSFIVWPAVLLVDMLAIIVAVTTAILAPMLVALVLTLVVAGAWLFKVPVETASLLPFLIVVGGFAAFFAVVGGWLTKRRAVADGAPSGPRSTNDKIASALPVMSAAMPFALLVMAIQRLPVPDPTPVFGLGLLLVLLQLALANFWRITPLTLASLVCMGVLEAAWHLSHYAYLSPWTPLLWYGFIYALFAVYPFVFRRSFQNEVLPWATAALAALAQYVMIYKVVQSSFPAMDNMRGLVPAIFAVPSLLSLAGALKKVESSGAARQGQLAWFGGMALFFITLIFPVQFKHQWITLGWALEGAALIWLFRRIPHPGLRGTGLFLLGAAFVRLAFNSEVLIYAEHSTVPIFNWYLYTYCIAALAMFLGAWWVEEPKKKVNGISVRGALWTMGGILLFWLLNIEIADYFTPAGSRFTVIEFTGINLGRDMTYSIAWGIFALGLILLGFLCNTRGARYAGIGLMALTLLKVFLHDLSSLESIYRVGALIGVAIIALVASFLYQRFFDRTNEPAAPSPEPDQDSNRSSM